MEKFYEILLISTSVVGFYVSFVLLLLARQNRLLNRLLGFYTLSCSIFFLLIYAAVRGWGSEPVVAIRTFSPILLISPAIGYLYFRALLEDETDLTTKDLLHAVPLILNLIYFSPLMHQLLTGHERWSEMVAGIKPGALFINPGPLPDEPIIIFRIAVTLVYVLLVIRFFILKRSYVEEMQGTYNSGKSKTWVLIVLAGHVFFGLSIIINQARAFISEYPAGLSYGGWSASIALLGLDLIIIYAVINPEILFGIPRFLRPVPDTSSVAVAPQVAQPAIGRSTGPATNAISRHDLPVVQPVPNPVTAEGANPGDSDGSAEQSPAAVREGRKAVEISETVQLLIERMHDHVARHQPYRNQEFNITTLSQALGVPQHHIAFIFRQVLHTSFVEYRNQLRIDHAKESIRMGKHKQITIEAIGTDAGFSSRATFFAVFKDLTGMTPGQYAEECSLNGTA